LPAPEQHLFRARQPDIPAGQILFTLVATTQQAILNSLPSWVQIDAAITNIANLADAKAFIRKLARVVYWLAKNTEA
jgi:hypothetical protein